MNIGDTLGGIYKKSKDGKEFWELCEDKINKIDITKKHGRRYYTKKQWYPLDADEVDENTKQMEESIGNGYIITREVFGLNENTRLYAERWVEWANENIDKAVSVIEGMEKEK